MFIIFAASFDADLYTTRIGKFKGQGVELVEAAYKALEEKKALPALLKAKTVSGGKYKSLFARIKETETGLQAKADTGSYIYNWFLNNPQGTPFDILQARNDKNGLIEVFGNNVKFQAKHINQFGPFSNYYEAQESIRYKRVAFKSIENLFQAYKVILKNGLKGKALKNFLKFMAGLTPDEARIFNDIKKSFPKKIPTDINKLRGVKLSDPFFNAARKQEIYDFMKGATKAKFLANSQLARLLVGTGTNGLVEGNKWGDGYWGVVLDMNNQPSGKYKVNNLGRVLMENRSEISKLAKNNKKFKYWLSSDKKIPFMKSYKNVEYIMNKLS